MSEALVPPALALGLALLLPFITGRLLEWAYLAELPQDPEQRARRLVPFRRAALLVGIGQLQLAWMAGASCLGPVLVDRPGSTPALLFGLLGFACAFLAGGVARRVEEPEEDRSTVLGAVLLRMRLLPFLVAPVAIALATLELPLTRAGMPPTPSWPWVLVALLLCGLGIAYGGLAAAVATGALRLAPPALRAMAREVAAREKTSLWLVLRLPTAGTRLTNAAALPWARTMVVTDRARELLDDDELRAVLAHEAGHLSESPRSTVARLGLATLLVFATIPGARLAAFLPAEVVLAVAAGLLLLVLALLVGVRRLARRMEERADRRAAETVGAAPLAKALRALHTHAGIPMTVGGHRVHPDLWDRLASLGQAVGDKPEPPPRRRGQVLGLTLMLVLVGAPALLVGATDVSADEVESLSGPRARWRLRLDPWDAEALMAMAWQARRADDIPEAKRWGRLAKRAAPERQAYYVLWSEIYAAEGECAAARMAFEDSLEAQAARLFRDDEALRLGDYALPPTLVEACGLGAHEGEPGDRGDEGDGGP